MKLLIVGGVAGGASAAARARRISESAEIVLFERDPDVSFANCGLPYHVGGEIPERDKLLVVTPERLRERFRLDVRVNSTVEALDRTAKRIRVRSGDRVYEEPYDKLILAPGAAPARPAVPGVDLPGIYTLRTLQDADRIKARVDAGAKRAVVIGGGFIGLELVENFIRRGLAVTVVERNPQVLTPFDAEMMTPIHEELRSRGVDLKLNASTAAFERTESGLDVVLESGERLPADVVAVGIGVRPENRLAVEAGLAVGPRGGVVVDEQLRTSDPDIYAVGDAIQTVDAATGDPVQVPLAGPANRQGRLAAEHALGRQTRWRGTQGTAIIRVFSKTAAITGASEKSLLRSGRSFRKIYVHPAHHAGYYPGAEGMTLKLLFEPDGGRILGAQGIGGAGVDKRIDVIAVAIQGEMTVFDMEEMELAYAPQFGSAKDPVNMAGFVASGLLRGEHPQMNMEEIESAKPFLLDVRTQEEFAAGHIPGAVNLPVDELRGRLAEVPKDRLIAAYCQVGQRGYLATRILLQSGFRAMNLGGGWKTWRLHHPD